MSRSFEKVHIEAVPDMSQHLPLPTADEDREDALESHTYAKARDFGEIGF